MRANGEPMPGVISRIDDVACKGETEARAETGAVHRCDGRHRDAGHPLDQGIEHVAQDRLAVLVQGIGVGEVAAAAEGPPFTPHEQRASAARLRLVERLGEVVHHREVHRVHLVRAVEHHFGDTTVEAVQDRSRALRFRHTARVPSR